MGQQMWPLAAIDHRLDSIPMCRDGHCGVTCRSLSPLDTRSSSIYSVRATLSHSHSLSFLSRRLSFHSQITKPTAVRQSVRPTCTLPVADAERTHLARTLFAVHCHCDNITE